MMICGSDCDLKDGIGTSDYVIYQSDSDEPLVTGYAAEIQKSDDASSTRQEMLS